MCSAHTDRVDRLFSPIKGLNGTTIVLQLTFF